VKKILHPTDFSINSAYALKFAHSLSEKFKASLIVMHVAEVPTIMNSASSPSFSGMEAEKKASITEELKKYWKATLGDISALLRVEFDVRLNSSTTKGILEAISEYEAGLVVMGTKGQSKLKEVVMGSTTKKLVAKSPCPVLAIPENVSLKEIRKIVYASDFDQYDMAVLKKVADFAAMYDAGIIVLHIFFSGEKKENEMMTFKQQLSEHLSYANIEYDFRISENVNQAIANYLQECKADLLVMFEKEEGLIDKLFVFDKDRVGKFATHTSVPLLSYNLRTLTPAERVI